MLIKAHAPRNCPQQNTLLSLEQNTSDGAQILELDIQTTFDGVVIAWHDPAICGREIALTTWEELYKIKPDLLRLEQALAFLKIHPDVELNLDIKNLCVLPRVAELTISADVQHRVSLSGIQFFEFADTLRFFPAQRIWVSSEYIPDGIAPAEENVYMQRCMGQASALGCRHLNCFIGNCSAALVEAAHKADICVHVWTVNDPHKIKQLYSWGVDSIATDFVLQTVRLLQSWKMEEN